MEARNTQPPHSIDDLPRPSLGGPPPGRLSLLSVHSNGSPSYDTCSAEPQPVDTATRKSPKRLLLTITFFSTLFFQLGALVLALLLLIAGTSQAPGRYSKASHAAILLQNLNILDIPIKYPFLCPEGRIQYDCEPRWSVKVYLDGVWAYEEVQGDYEPVHLLQKGMGDIFNLTNTLTVMDERLSLRGQGINRNYTVPTEPTQHIRSMTPLNLRIPIVLLIIGMALAIPLFIAWIWKFYASSRIIQHRWILLIVTTIFALFLATAIYLQTTASKACEQVRGNTTYVSGRVWQASFNPKFQALITATAVLQLVTLLTFILYARLEKRTSTDRHASVEEGNGKAKRGKKGGAGKTDPTSPGYDLSPTDLEVIRMTELMTLREIHSRRSSISEISHVSRLSRTCSNT